MRTKLGSKRVENGTIFIHAVFQHIQPLIIKIGTSVWVSTVTYIFFARRTNSLQTKTKKALVMSAFWTNIVNSHIIQLWINGTRCATFNCRTQIDPNKEMKTEANIYITAIFTKDWNRYSILAAEIELLVPIGMPYYKHRAQCSKFKDWNKEKSEKIGSATSKIELEKNTEL